MRIIHYLPGRVRIELPEILNNAILSEALHQHLLLVEGIVAVIPNRCSGRILITYAPEKVGLAKLMGMIQNHFIRLIEGQDRRGGRRKQSEIGMKLNFADAKTIAAEAAVTAEPGFAREIGSGPYPFRPETTNYVTLDYQDVLNQLGTDAASGLNLRDAETRLNRYGANLLPSPPQPTVLGIFVRTLTESYMSKVLLGLGAFSLILGKTANACMSIGVLVANTTMAVVQERRTQNSLRALSDLVPARATVVRNGSQQQVEVGKLVPGDVILLDAGEKVPADARLLSASQLVVEEASLTGESVPVVKEPEARQRDNTVYMGTAVLSGTAKAVVISTGAGTEIGRISRTIVTKPSKTPFHQRLDEVFATLVHGGLALSGIAVLAGLSHKESLGNIVESATGLAVSFIPDGLAPIITVATALGAMRLLKKNVALRQLPAVDTLGCTTVICCDKTGTLTRNKMEVQEVYSPGMHWRLEGEQFVPLDKTGEPQPYQASLRQVFCIAALCNNAALKETAEGQSIAEGDSTECALLLGGIKVGFSLKEESSNFKRIMEIPFSSDTMYMAVLVEDRQRQLWSMVKGAPDVIVERCTAIERGGRVLPLTPGDKEEILTKMSQMSGRALRVLAMAYRPWEQEQSPDRELIFTGLVGIIDPPRPEAQAFLQECRKAGVKVVMITGDHRDTALAIARQIGVVDSAQAKVLTGNEMANMRSQELTQAVNTVRVYARTSPKQKQMLVRALKNSGEIVTMVGDGVNDVPAIKEAHLGVAMAASGTAVARETSAVALTDDNIGGLVEAIKEGRNVYANIRSTMRYMITTNFGDGIVLLLASLLGQPLPLTPLQLLWVNFTSDPYVSWSLANFPPSTNIMQGPPRQANASVFGQGLGRQILSRSLCLGLSAFMVYNGSLTRGETIESTRTKTMATLGLGRLLHVTDFRRARQETQGANKTLLRGGLLMLSTLLGVTYIPGLSARMQTKPLTLADWFPVLGWVGAGYLADTGFNRLQGSDDKVINRHKKLSTGV